MKKKYEKPELQKFPFENVDILTGDTVSTLIIGGDADNNGGEVDFGKLFG